MNRSVTIIIILENDSKLFLAVDLEEVSTYATSSVEQFSMAKRFNCSVNLGVFTDCASYLSHSAIFHDISNRIFITGYRLISRQNKD